MDRAFDATAVVAWARISGASAIVAMPKFDGVALAMLLVIILGWLGARGK